MPGGAARATGVAAQAAAVGVYASLLGSAISAGRSHHISDVYGAFLLAAAVGALALVGRAPSQHDGRQVTDRLSATRIALVIAAIIAGLLLLKSWRIIGEPHYLPGLAATAAAVSALAFLILAAYERLLEIVEFGRSSCAPIFPWR